MRYTECLKEIVSEETAEMQRFEVGVVEFTVSHVISCAPRYECEAAYSADKACVPASILFLTSCPKP